MFYTLQITAEPASDQPAAMHRPATIETFTGRKENVTDEDIEMVAEAFKAQVKQLLLAMVRLGA